jgi:hypothetical protein
MGFALIYLTPAFFTDTTEGVVLCPPFERVLITVAGVWSEFYLCTAATIIWWGTPPGSVAHDFAYVMMLMTGIATLLLNWNPLMKLDGYYILCDIIGVLDLKEHSTAYVSAWVKRHVWRLPVEVPYVPKRRRLGLCCRIRPLQLHRAFHTRKLCGERLSQLQCRLVIHSGAWHWSTDFPVSYSFSSESYEIHIPRQKGPHLERVDLSTTAMGGDRSCGASLPPTVARVDQRTFCAGGF